MALPPVVISYNLKMKAAPLSLWAPPLPPSALYVGSGDKSFPLRPSPWMNPFMFICRSSQDAHTRFKKLCWSRPDLLYWILPVSKASVLVCDCKSSQHTNCNAKLLISIVRKLGTAPKPEHDIEDDEMICEPCEEPWEEPAVAFRQEHLQHVNETLRPSVTVPNQVGYQESWLALIHSVRPI